MAPGMRDTLPTRWFSLLNSQRKECGQDIVEYALLAALIAFGVTAGMNSVASKVNTIFTNIGATMTGNT